MSNLQYSVSIYCVDTGRSYQETYNQAPLVPKIGEKIYAGCFEGVGDRTVREVTYGYSESLISISITVFRERS